MRVIKLIITLCCFNLSTAYAIIDIEITKAMDGALPIAVIPFYSPDIEPVNVDAAEVVRNDLARSGEFITMPVHRMLDKPSESSEVKYNYWRRSGVEGLVMGKVVALDDARYQVDVQLLHLFSGGYKKTERSNFAADEEQLLISKQFIIKKNQLRQLAHHISDLVYEELTGIRGAFSTKIAYVVTKWKNDKISRYSLEVADADGYNPKAILSSTEPVMSPSWSPNGKQIAYVSFENFRAEVYISDVRTGERKMVSALPGINGAPAWAPDGRSLALVLSKESAPKIFTLDLQSGRLKQLTYGRSLDTEPRWSPDGQSIFYTSNRGGKPQIYRYTLANGKSARVTYDGNYNARASITPDGKRMVMIHRNDKHFQIAVQELSSNQVMVLTDTSLDESPSLSPNGRMVIYGTLERGRRVLGAVSLDARVKLSIPVTDGEVQEPAWSPFLS